MWKNELSADMFVEAKPTTTAREKKIVYIYEDERKERKTFK